LLNWTKQQMILQFHTLEIRATCEDEGSAQAALGEEAEALFSVLADLRAARNLADVPASLLQFDPTEFTNFYVQLVTSRLVLSQNMQKVPLDGQRKLRLSEVTRVRVVEIRR
jgi:hypothetical protein